MLDAQPRVHLLVETGSTPLAKFMQGLQQSYTQYFNRHYRKVGHLFQGRYQAIIYDRDTYLLALIRYIHLNAVRAKLATRPERYRYSGHNSYLTDTRAKIVETTPVLKLMGGKKAYERFVLDGMGEEHNEAYYAVEDQRFLGGAGFGEEISRDVEEISNPKRKKPIETMFKEIARRVGGPPEIVRSNTGAGVWLRGQRSGEVSEARSGECEYDVIAIVGAADGERDCYAIPRHNLSFAAPGEQISDC